MRFQDLCPLIFKSIDRQYERDREAQVVIPLVRVWLKMWNGLNESPHTSRCWYFGPENSLV